MTVAAKLKEHLITAVIVVFGVAGLYLAMRAREFGISVWLGSVLALTTFLCFVLVFSFRALDPFRKRASVLMVGGLFCLSAAGLVNELVVPFFTPSMLDLLLAFLPSILFVGYRAYKDRANAQSK